MKGLADHAAGRGIEKGRPPDGTLLSDRPDLLPYVTAMRLPSGEKL